MTDQSVPLISFPSSSSSSCSLLLTFDRSGQPVIFNKKTSSKKLFPRLSHFSSLQHHLSGYFFYKNRYIAISRSNPNTFEVYDIEAEEKESIEGEAERSFMKCVFSVPNSFVPIFGSSFACNWSGKCLYSFERNNLLSIPSVNHLILFGTIWRNRFLITFEENHAKWKSTIGRTYRYVFYEICDGIMEECVFFMAGTGFYSDPRDQR